MKPLDLQASNCGLCWSAPGVTCVPRPGDEDDAMLCDRCASPGNLELVTRGRPAFLPDGSPTWMVSDAMLDPTLAYRYQLARAWARPKGVTKPVLWIMLNPSTADAQVDDPTIRRIMGFTDRWGRSQFAVVNLFGFRTAYPHLIPRRFADAVGAQNDQAIFSALQQVDLVIAAWGAPAQAWLTPMVRDRIAAIRCLVAAAGRELCALGVTKEGAPKHPLARGLHRIPDHAQPAPWSPR